VMSSFHRARTIATRASTNAFLTRAGDFPLCATCRNLAHVWVPTP